MNPFTFLLEMMPYILPIIIVGIIFGSITSIVKAKQERKAKGSGSLSEEEAEIMKEMHRSLTAMERRIEALETLLINRK